MELIIIILSIFYIMQLSVIWVGLIIDDKDSCFKTKKQFLLAHIPIYPIIVFMIEKIKELD